MIRAPLGNVSYWNQVVEDNDGYLLESQRIMREPAGNPDYAPQYAFNIAKKHWHQILRRYSAGNPIADLSRYFPGLLDAWEEAERLGATVWTPEQQFTRHSWRVNYDHYIVCFWLVGLGLALEIPDDQWRRLLALIGNEGEDVLLDRVIASRSPERKVGAVLLYPKPYGRLLAAVDAPVETQASKLEAFVSHWYQEVRTGAKSGSDPQAVSYKHPYWYTYGDENFEGGAYFGRWCVEAVAAVKAFGLDDSQCLGLEHYPGDLLRPDGPSTHPLRQDAEAPIAVVVENKVGFWSKLLGRR
ncbi:PoNe immunity protein domain-containing protein [Pseudomonas sp. P97.38]|uniref:PoNe immunity protein domain-containing protein n=1 Tax=Pseudomonas sp. P97.38 TaxID=255451 RepID=UPI00069D58FA|nr:PoNe immunity protein domain-containing protein [Pseudomonas sp. P97.38]